MSDAGLDCFFDFGFGVGIAFQRLSSDLICPFHFIDTPNFTVAFVHNLLYLILSQYQISLSRNQSPNLFPLNVPLNNNNNNNPPQHQQQLPCPLHIHTSRRSHIIPDPS